MEATIDPRWRKSSKSGNGGQCVEVADHDNRVMVRDSKNPEGTKLAFTTALWKAFTAKVKASLAHRCCRRRRWLGSAAGRAGLAGPSGVHHRA